MTKFKNIKLLIGLVYLTILSIFLYFLLSKFTIQEIQSYEFIKSNLNYFQFLKEKNNFIVSFLFIIFSAIWVFLAGFLSPLAIFSGFMFGKWFGLIYVVLGGSLGATALYLFANYFLKDLIKKNFTNKFSFLAEKFEKSELVYLLLYRFIGGIPFVISNMLPCIFNVKPGNFFVSTVIGISPQIFLIASIGSSLEKILNMEEEMPKISEIIFLPSIYIPIVIFIFLIILSMFLKKIFYKK
jgi:uncharacterized membrane protein YdjX (TVP38/TMEM64 family)